MNKRYTVDFETTTDINDCRVWAYGICDIDDFNNIHIGNSIDDFIEFFKKENNAIAYFHNIKFDIQFLFYWLFTHGYNYIQNTKERKDKTFTALISDMGQFYSCTIYFHVTKSKTRKVTFYDSLKILNFSVDYIAKSFGFDTLKLDMDYTAYREIDHIITDDEKQYIKHDVLIMAKALKIIFDMGLNKITIASNAFNEYKSLNRNFFKYFPILSKEIDDGIRQAYKGGFTYLNDKYEDKIIYNGNVLDVNSLYPYVLRYKKLPIGYPIYFKGQYKDDKLFPLYVQVISCSFDIKLNKIPTIQLKNSLSFIPNQYLKSTNGDIVTMCLTNIDLEMFLEHYDVYNLEYHEGYKFRGIAGLFNVYVDKWIENKTNAKKDGNKPLYMVSKLMLNSLYGKFGLNPRIRGKYPYLGEDDIIHYHYTEPEYREPIYVALAAFVTAYARQKTINTSQAITDYSLNKYGKDLYVYSDTDSIHTLLSLEDLKEICEIDEFNLGAWKHEEEFKRAKFIRQKCYIEETDNGLNVVVAGLPKRLAKIVNFDNFKKGFTTQDLEIEEKKLTYKYCPGGVVLANIDFTIK